VKVSSIVRWVVALGCAWAVGWLSCLAMGITANKRFQPRVNRSVQEFVMDLERGVMDGHGG